MTARTLAISRRLTARFKFVSALTIFMVGVAFFANSATVTGPVATPTDTPWNGQFRQLQFTPLSCPQNVNGTVIWPVTAYASVTNGNFSTNLEGGFYWIGFVGEGINGQPPKTSKGFVPPQDTNTYKLSQILNYATNGLTFSWTNPAFGSLQAGTNISFQTNGGYLVINSSATGGGASTNNWTNAVTYLGTNGTVYHAQNADNATMSSYATGSGSAASLGSGALTQVTNIVSTATSGMVTNGVQDSANNIVFQVNATNTYYTNFEKSFYMTPQSLVFYGPNGFDNPTKGRAQISIDSQSDNESGRLRLWDYNGLFIDLKNGYGHFDAAVIAQTFSDQYGQLPASNLILTDNKTNVTLGGDFTVNNTLDFSVYASSIIDNYSSFGNYKQVLTAGSGGGVVWADSLSTNDVRTIITNTVTINFLAAVGISTNSNQFTSWTVGNQLNGGMFTNLTAGNIVGTVAGATYATTASKATNATYAVTATNLASSSFTLNLSGLTGSASLTTAGAATLNLTNTPLTTVALATNAVTATNAPDGNAIASLNAATNIANASAQAATNNLPASVWTLGMAWTNGLYPWPKVVYSQSEGLDSAAWYYRYPQYAYSFMPTNGAVWVNCSTDAPSLGFNDYIFRTSAAATNVTFSVWAATPAGTTQMKLYLCLGTDTSTILTNATFTVTTNLTQYSVAYPCSNNVYGALVWLNGAGVTQGNPIIYSNSIVTSPSLPAYRSLITPEVLSDNNQFRPITTNNAGFGVVGYGADSLSYFDFMTAATNLVVEIVDRATYTSAGLQVILAVNDSVVTNWPSLASANTNALLLNQVNLPSGFKKVTLVNSCNTRGSFGHDYNGMTVRSVFSDAPLFLVPKKPAQRVAIFGDSILAGQAATYPGWTSLVPNLRRMGYSVVDVAAGWDRMQDWTNAISRLTKYLTQNNPNCVVLNIGHNDYGAGTITSTNFQIGYSNLLAALVSKTPSPIVAISPIKATTETANAVGNTLTDYRVAISNTVAFFPQAFYVEGSNIVTSALADGVHPTDVGFAQFTKAMINILSTNQ
jgi:GDSL-like Lipase/Acylhydrolase family